MVKVNIRKTDNSDNIDLPIYATKDSAGVDLVAAIKSNITLVPGARTIIRTGISIALPDGYEAQIRPRSGLAFKYGITVLNSPGTIDADYRGEIGVILINLGDEDFTITPKMRIAQMVISKYSRVEFLEVENLDDTERGDGGFGSTGLKEIANYA